MSGNVFVHVTCLNGIAFCGLCVIAYTLDQICKFLKTHRRLINQKVSDLHNQLGKRLHLQAIAPFLFWFNTFVLVIFGITMNNVLILMFIPYPWITVINSIITIISIQSYRRTVIKWIQSFIIFTRIKRIMISFVDINIKNHINPADVKN